MRYIGILYIWKIETDLPNLSKLLDLTNLNE